MNNQKYIVALIFSILIAGGGGYYMGTKKSPLSVTAHTQSGDGTFTENRLRGQGRSRTGGAFTGGEIVSIDAQSITVQSQDGGSVIVFYSANTPITKMASGTPRDLLLGKSIMINGKTNPDGSVTAESIQLRPEASSRQIINSPIIK
jgi:Domain of unknown function (DUF5666)